MNTTFISALNDSRSLQFSQLASKVEKKLLVTIQVKYPNAVAVQVTNFLSTSNGASIISVFTITITITITVNINISSSVQANLLQAAIQNGISNGSLTSLNVSQTYIIPNVTRG